LAKSRRPSSCPVSPAGGKPGGNNPGRIGSGKRARRWASRLDFSEFDTISRALVVVEVSVGPSLKIAALSFSAFFSLEASVCAHPRPNPARATNQQRGQIALSSMGVLLKLDPFPFPCVAENGVTLSYVRPPRTFLILPSGTRILPSDEAQPFDQEPPRPTGARTALLPPWFSPFWQSPIASPRRARNGRLCRTRHAFGVIQGTIRRPRSPRAPFSLRIVAAASSPPPRNAAIVRGSSARQAPLGIAVEGRRRPSQQRWPNRSFWPSTPALSRIERVPRRVIQIPAEITSQKTRRSLPPRERRPPPVSIFHLPPATFFNFIRPPSGTPSPGRRAFITASKIDSRKPPCGR